MSHTFEEVKEAFKMGVPWSGFGGYNILASQMKANSPSKAVPTATPSGSNGNLIVIIIVLTILLLLFIALTVYLSYVIKRKYEIKSKLV